jgi:hypothetical protein
LARSLGRPPKLNFDFAAPTPGIVPTPEHDTRTTSPSTIVISSRISICASTGPSSLVPQFAWRASFLRIFSSSFVFSS